MTEDANQTELPLERVPDAPVPVAQPEPLELMRQAIDQGIDPQALVTLSELAKEWEQRRAARTFAEGFRAFKAACPVLWKSRRVDVATKRGSPYSYYFCPLDEITNVVDPILHRLGFTYSWDSTVESGQMIVTCTLRHDDGHEKSGTFVAPLASGSPTMSEIQKHASSMTYARRQSLIAVLGLTTADTDTDAAETDTFVTDEQAAELRDLAEHPNVDTEAFLAWALGIDKDADDFAEQVGKADFGDVRAGQYEKAKSMLRRKAGIE